MPIVSTGQFTITDVNDSPLAVLSNESAVVPSAPNGSSPVLTGCVTTISINLGGVDDSVNWTFSATPSSGVTGTLSARTYTVTGFTVDAGWVDLTATRVGWPSLVKRFNLSKTKQGVTGATGAAGLNGLNFSEAKLMFTDPTFQVGTNSLGVYNNSANGTVTHTRVAKQTDSPFTDSGFNIEIANTGAALPGIGGFFQSFNARASAVFVQRIVAKVPVGYYLEQATNPLGDGATNTWITSKAGTGKFEEYLLVRRCGATGSFSNSGHIYAVGAAGTPAAPVKWWLAYATAYDFTALGFSTVVGLLSNDSHTVATDSAGNNGNFTGAATTLTIYNGTTDDSANWSVTATPTNVTGTLSGRTYTVTAMSADTGFVDLTATRGGFSNVVKRFTLTKSKGGVTGATGAQGPQGVQGVQGPAVVVTPSRAATFTATDGTLDGSQTDIVFTAAVSGVTSPTYAWTFDGLQTNPTASTTSTQTITAAQFGTSKAAIVTCTVSGAYTDKVSIVRLERSTAAAGANQTYIDANGTVQGVSSGAGTQVDNSKVYAGLAGAGGSLVPDYNLAEFDRWRPSVSGYDFSTANFVTVTDGKVGPTVFRRADTSKQQCWNYSKTAIPLVAGRRYRTEFWGRRSAGASAPWFVNAHLLKADGTQNTSDGAGYAYISLTPPTAGGGWQLVGGVWDPTWVAARLAAGTVAIQPGFALEHNGALTAGNWAEAQGFRFIDLTVETNADSALTQLRDIASDSVLAPAEKREVRKQWDVAINEKAGLNSEASRYTNAAAANTTYNTTIQALGTYLNGGAAYTLSTTTPPAWINDASLTTSTAIVGATFRANWQAHFVARQALVNKITEEAGKVATWSGVSGAGKPLDNAGQVLDTRNDNTPPNGYTKGNHREFKFCTTVGITTSATYCVVETIKGWADSSGGEAVQWAYVTSGEVWKRSAPAGATTWNAWVRDMDLGLYTGALNATNNVVGQGTLATRPVGTDGDFYYATDTGAMYQKIAGAWVLSSNNTSIDASGNIQGVSGGAGQSVANNGDSVIRAPAGGVFVTTAGTLTGALKIKLPQLSSSTMIRFTVDIHEYLAGYSCSIELAGYNHSSGWINVTARVIGGSNVEYPVRFGRDADKNCIWVGNSNETWSYPQVRVRDVFLGYSNYSAAQWSSGWAISFDTTALTAGSAANQYSAQVLDTLPGADWAKTSGANKPADNATVGAPTGTNVGSTPAETVEGNANNAYNALTDPATGLNQRMRINADNVLGGVLIANTTSAPVGVRVGTVSWSADGTVIDGTGVAITPKGVYARNPAKTTFVLDATTGDATFSGNLTGANITGATGTFSGSLTAETLGSLAQAPITITTSQIVTVPAGMNSARYELVGGGGGGGGGATGFVEGYGGGGGSGAYMSGTISVTPGASLAITIGSGGAGGANTLAGGNGGSSSIGALVTAAGGTGGGGSAANAGYGIGGATPASVPTNASKPGNTAAKSYDSTKSTYGGFGTFNGEAKYDGAGFPIPEVSGAGGSNPKGTGGASISTGLGLTGSGYGSGGSGGGGSTLTNASAVGGAGKPGLCILTFVNTNGVVLQGQFESLKQVLAAQGIAVA